MIASSTRLERLEKFYERRTHLEEKAAGQPSTSAILSEISKLDKRDKRLSVPAEKPVRFVGNLRDPTKKDSTTIPDIGSLSIELIANGIYSKTFTIDHR